ALPKHFPENAATEAWVPCRRHMWAEPSIERIVGILAASVADQLVSKLWKKDLAVECGRFPVAQVVLRGDGRAALVHRHRLQTAGFIRRHFQCPGKPVSESKSWPHTPAIAEVDVVGRNDAVSCD